MAVQNTEAGFCHAGRGDVAIRIGGTDHGLSLTLAALAEIEAGLDVRGFAALGEALQGLDARGLTVVLSALLSAGGAAEARALAERAEPSAAARAVAACFKANLR